MIPDKKSLHHTKYLNRQEVKKLRKAVQDKALADLSRGPQVAGLFI